MSAWKPPLFCALTDYLGGISPRPALHAVRSIHPCIHPPIHSSKLPASDVSFVRGQDEILNNSRRPAWTQCLRPDKCTSSTGPTCSFDVSTLALFLRWIIHWSTSTYQNKMFQSIGREGVDFLKDSLGRSRIKETIVTLPPPDVYLSSGSSLNQWPLLNKHRYRWILFSSATAVKKPKGGVGFTS